MSTITIRINGLDEVRKALGEAGAVQALRPAVEKSLNTIVDRVADYPPPITGQAYVRTGTLGKKWPPVEMDSDGLSGKIGTNVKYAPYVQDDEKQAAIHKGRWETVSQAMESMEPEIVEIFQKQIEQVIDDFNKS